jgi:hypothetical protein
MGARVLQVRRPGQAQCWGASFGSFETAAKWGQVTVDGHSAPPAGKSTRPKHRELLKIQPITVPLTVTCMIAEPLPGCLGLVQLTLKLAATQNLRWSAELNPGFCSNGRPLPNVRGKPDDASFGLPDRASTCTM